MCQITIYRGTESEDAKLMDDVSQYEIDLSGRKIRAQKMMGEEMVFTIENNVRWNSRKDTLII